MTAPTALAQVYLNTIVGQRPLEEAVAAGRLHHNGEPDVVFYEANTDPSTLQALQGAGP